MNQIIAVAQEQHQKQIETKKQHCIGELNQSAENINDIDCLSTSHAFFKDRFKPEH